MRDPSGISRGSGFVAFSTSEEASIAVSTELESMMMLLSLFVECVCVGELILLFHVICSLKR